MQTMPWRHTENAAATRRRLARFVLAATLAFGMTACAALPRNGPASADIDPIKEDGALQGLVAPLTAEVAEKTLPPEAPGFPPPFRDAPAMRTDLLGPDDIIDVTIWEGAQGGLFSSGASGGAVTLPTLRVNARGAVSIPFAGTVRAAGGDTEQLQRRIRAALSPLTVSPEVSVRVAEPISRRVTIQGAVASPGAFTIEPGVTRLTPLLALAGGATMPPDQVDIVVRRDGRSGADNLARIYADPARDIALRPHDTILLDQKINRFSVLGATSVQAELTFPTNPLDLLGALGAARGLRDLDADPRAIFVFRWEDPALADALLPGPRPEGIPDGPGRPIVYRLNITDPEAMFVARRFRMRDGDAIFVSNAPLAELRKFLQLFTTVLTPVQQTTTLSN